VSQSAPRGPGWIILAFLAGALLLALFAVRVWYTFFAF
jgi:hypothetical protein